MHCSPSTWLTTSTRRLLGTSTKDLRYANMQYVQTSHFDDAYQFYNDFATILTQFRDTCKDWVHMRKREIQ